MEGYGFRFMELHVKDKLTNSYYDEWVENIEASLFSAGCHQIIFGQPPLTRPPRLFNTFSFDAGTERTIADWNKSNQAGVFSISLNVSASQKFLIQQNRQANVLELREASTILTMTISRDLEEKPPCQYKSIT